MMEFKNEFDREIIYGSKFTKVKIINSKYKNLDFKFPPNTNFKRLGLEIEPETWSFVCWRGIQESSDGGHSILFNINKI